MLDKFLSAQNFLREHLGLDLPDDWVKFKNKGDALVEQLTPKIEKLPMCCLCEISYALCGVTSSSQERTLAEKISEKCREIRQERPAPPRILPQSSR